jgi:hypothetical protein
MSSSLSLSGSLSKSTGIKSVAFLALPLKANGVGGTATTDQERASAWLVASYAAFALRRLTRSYFFDDGRKRYRLSTLEHSHWRLFACTWRVVFPLTVHLRRRREAAAILRGALAAAGGSSSLGAAIKRRLQNHNRYWFTAGRLIIARTMSRRHRLLRVMIAMHRVEDRRCHTAAASVPAITSQASPLHYPFALSGRHLYTLDHRTGAVSHVEPLRDDYLTRPVSSSLSSSSHVYTFSEPHALSDIPRQVVGAGDSLGAARLRIGMVPLLFRFKVAVATAHVEQEAAARCAAWLQRRHGMRTHLDWQRSEYVSERLGAAMAVAASQSTSKMAFRKRHALSTAATARSSVRHGALFPSEAAASTLVDDARRLQDEELSKLFVVPSAYVRLGRAPPYETEMCRVGEASLRREIQESHEAEASMLRRCGVRSSKWPASRLPPRQQIDLDDQSPLAACDLALASRGASGVAARSAALVLCSIMQRAAERATREQWLRSLRFRLGRQLGLARKSPSLRAGAPVRPVPHAGNIALRQLRGRTPPRERLRRIRTGECNFDPYFVRGVDDSADMVTLLEQSQPTTSTRKVTTRSKKQRAKKKDLDD